MHARTPDSCGYAVNDGVRLYYEVHGTTGPTLVLLPTWSIVDSQSWKMQVPYLSRHYRVVRYDPRGNGRSDRPQDDAAYTEDILAADLRAVMRATDTDQAVLVGYCTGVRAAVLFANDHPDQVLGLVAIATNLPYVATPEPRAGHGFRTVLDSYEGWDKDNLNYWLQDWPGYVDFFMTRITSEPHSSKLYDDLVEWGLQTDAPTMICTNLRTILGDQATAEAAIEALRCPSLVIYGDADEIVAGACSERYAEITGAEVLVIEGGGHAVHARHPVVVNHAIRDFADRVAPRATGRQRSTGKTSARVPSAASTWTFARKRPRKALWISSPIGLGHVLRDLAIAREVRARVPDLEVEWLAQPPVTQVLEASGEIVHPASAQLASESAHWESEAVAGGHDLHAFYAFRRMDEILLANYMLFDEVTTETPYDLWVGDECWEVDHYLHENPERKTAPYVFTTDVVGFLPVDAGADPREAELCADYNAEMIEHRARYPKLRDVSLFIGGYDELPDASFGPGLPQVRDWTREWFDAVPYVVPFDPSAYRDPAEWKRRLGHDLEAPLLVASVGGTSVGHDLLNLTAEGFRYLRKEIPNARMLMVTGPRIDPRDIADVDGMSKVGYVPNLFEHLAACDAAVVQGGLSTTMELVAAGRPFVYFPLRNHWEQQHFVSHRLDHYGAGHRLDFEQTSPVDLSAAMANALARKPHYRPLTAAGAAAAAARIVPLLTR